MNHATKSSREISTLASAVVAARQFKHRSIITFLPESARLELAWRCELAKVRAERGNQWRELLGVTR